MRLVCDLGAILTNVITIDVRVIGFVLLLYERFQFPLRVSFTLIYLFVFLVSSYFIDSIFN